MKKIEITRYAYDFTDHELQVIRECLAYGRHRLNEHPESGITKSCAEVTTINRLLEEFPKLSK